MRSNLPVTQHEHLVAAGLPLLSATDAHGTITHCDAAFVDASGYALEELLGQPHSIVRHPDVPEAVFRDLWRTLGSGQTWTGVLKNRRRNGDHYWVEARISPVLVHGRPNGYRAVGGMPSRSAIAEAEWLYRLLQDEEAGRPAGWQPRTDRARRTAGPGAAGAALAAQLRRFGADWWPGRSAVPAGPGTAVAPA